MLAYGLTLHPVKSKIVDCWSYKEVTGGAKEEEKFDFLGYTFRRRTAQTATSRKYDTFTPAVSDKAKKKIREAMKALKISKYTDQEIEDIQRRLNPKIKGWNNYYGKFRKWELYVLFRGLDLRIVKWYRNKYRAGSKEAWRWINERKAAEPELFAHWKMLEPARYGRAV
jgi:hypothetical protein